jgi:hypothetical protein
MRTQFAEKTSLKMVICKTDKVMRECLKDLPMFAFGWKRLRVVSSGGIL